MTLASGDLSIAICMRCGFKYEYKELSQDPNIKGLRVCADCKDDYDPWRLPPPQPDPLQLRWPRPDESLDVPDNDTFEEEVDGEVAP